MMETLNQDAGKAAWNAKVKIAECVVPVLKAYKSLVQDGEAYSIPTWVVENEEELSESEKNQRWIAYLDEMIDSFNFELGKEVMSDSMLDKQEQGLMLFAKYFKHLWD